MDLFDSIPEEKDAVRPLAIRMSPQTLEEYVGQEHLLGPGKLLRRFWKPTGSFPSSSTALPAQARRPLPGWWPVGPKAGSPPSTPSPRVSPICERFSTRRRKTKNFTSAPRSFSWMRSTISTRASRTPSCPIWNRARLSWWGRPPRTPFSHSTTPCFPAPGFAN